MCRFIKQFIIYNSINKCFEIRLRFSGADTYIPTVKERTTMLYTGMQGDIRLKCPNIWMAII